MHAAEAMWNNLAVNLAAASSHDVFLVACVAGTVLLLLVLIGKLRLHPSLALAIAGFALGLGAGMPLKQVPLSFAGGVGNMMGHIAIVLGMGAILGRLLAASGGATALGGFLFERCGTWGLPWAMMGMGIVVGMPVFLEVGLVLLMPVIAEAARRSGKPPILVGLPVLAGLSIVHATLPPHPAAMLAATAYHADLGKTILFGLAGGLPAAIIAGPVLAWVLIRYWKKHKGWLAAGAEESTLFAPTVAEDLRVELQAEGATVVSSGPAHEVVPAPVGPLRALAAILMPVALICLGSWADAMTAVGSLPNQMLHFTGSPDVAMLLAVLIAVVMLGGHIQTGREHGTEMLRKLTAESFEPIAGVLVILAAAGGLSGVLRDSGAAQATVGLALGAHMPALVLAWLLAAVVRISMGSATVAMAVSSGILAPIAGHAGVQPELLVLATGCGSLIMSHVNDSGFWIVSSFFKMDMKQTLATWTLMETVLSVAGLGATLVLAGVLR